MKTLKVVVFGIVQGVGFRFFCKALADKLNINGWVRNNPDGSLELRLQGSNEFVETFLKILEKGPVFSRVEKIQKSITDEEKFGSFDVSY